MWHERNLQANWESRARVEDWTLIKHEEHSLLLLQRKLRKFLSIPKHNVMNTEITQRVHNLDTRQRTMVNLSPLPLSARVTETSYTFGRSLGGSGAKQMLCWTDTSCFSRKSNTGLLAHNLCPSLAGLPRIHMPLIKWQAYIWKQVKLEPQNWPISKHL